MDMTFFAWGDTHFGYEQGSAADDFRADIIRQMNELPGRSFPGEMGGVVAQPDFVMHCGDFLTDSIDGDHDLLIYQRFISDLQFPHYETQGNHDLGNAAVDYLNGRYGGDCHVFSVKGVECISLSAEYDEREKSSIPQKQLAFLQDALGRIENDVPAIVFTHSPFRYQANSDEAAEILKGHRIALAVGAHKHCPDFYTWQGMNSIDLGHCRNHPNDPGSGRSFIVIEMTGNRIRALPWRWDLCGWDCRQRFRIDAQF